MSQGMVIMRRRDFNAVIALRQVMMRGIHKARARTNVSAKMNRVGIKLGKAATMAKMEEISQAHATQEQAPKNN